MPLFGPPAAEELEAKRDVDGLIRLLSYKRESNDWKAAGVRRDAAAALGRLKDSRAIKPLFAAASDYNVEQAAFEALGKIGGTEVTEGLVRLLGEYSFLHRECENVAYALGRIRDIRAVEPLCTLLSNWVYPCDAEAAATALGEIGDTRAVEPLIALLRKVQDKDIGINESVTKALGQIGDARAVEPLIAFLRNAQDKKGSANKVAINALGRFRDVRAVELLIVMLDKNAPLYQELLQAKAENVLQLIDDLRQTTASALGQIGDARAVQPLVAVLEGYEHQDGVKRAAADALSKIGILATAPLIEALKSKDWEARVSAAVLLDKLGWRPVQDEHGAYYHIAKSEWNKCVEIGLPSVGPLIASLNIWQARKAVAKTLMGIHDERVIEALIETLHLQDERFIQIIEMLRGIHDLRVFNELLAYIEKTGVSELRWEDKYGGTSLMLAEALIDYHDPRSVTILENMLNGADFSDKDNEIKICALIATEFGNMADPRFIQPLRSKLRPNYTPHEIIDALKKIDHPTAREIVSQAQSFYERCSRSNKRCGNCGKTLPYDQKLSTPCPHCGVEFYGER